MEMMIKNTRVSVVQGDITKQTTEAVVNAANPGLMGGGGVDGAIHRAGGPAILEECKEIISRQGRLPTGKAVITTGGNLRARYVVHTVGPVWHGGGRGEAELLRRCYRECLMLAAEKRMAGISFPSISTGAYGYPLNEAAQMAVDTVVSFLRERDISLTDVVFVLFDAKAYDTYRSTLEEMAGGSL